MSRGEVKQRRLPWVVGDFFRVVSAHRADFAAGLPALLAGGAACALALTIWATSEETVLARYAQKAAQFAVARDFSSALVCYDRLVRERGPLPELRYRQALILEEKGGKDDLAMANAILRQLAPVSRPGYLPAHMKIARSLLISTDRSPPTLRALERHLKYALDGPDSVEANALLGRLLAGTGRSDQAEPYLTKAVPTHPELLLLLASLARQRGETHKFQERVEQAARTFQKKAEANPDDIQARFYWAAATVLTDDHAKAVAILERGLKLTADPRYGPMLGQVFVAWADRLGREGKSPLGDHLALLERGLKYNPKNTDLLDRLGAVLRVGGPDGERVRAALMTLLAEGKASAWLHFVLGADASSQGRTDEARLHWEQAFRLEPDLAVVANNLAWVLAHANPPDLNRALDLANRAVERRPKDARLRGTRGVVLMKLGRWSEALTDLEAELESNPESQALHQSLAEVYDHLGSPDMASRHRARAEAKNKVEGKADDPARPKAGSPKG